MYCPQRSSEIIHKSLRPKRSYSTLGEDPGHMLTKRLSTRLWQWHWSSDSHATGTMAPLLHHCYWYLSCKLLARALVCRVCTQLDDQNQCEETHERRSHALALTIQTLTRATSQTRMGTCAHKHSGLARREWHDQSKTGTGRGKLRKVRDDGYHWIYRW